MKPDFWIVSFSGGKDSTAMLLRLLEEKWPVDMILFVDTGLEFPAMYDHIDKVEQYIGRPITRIKAEHDFEITSATHQSSVVILKNSESSSAVTITVSAGWGRKCGGVPIA